MAILTRTEMAKLIAREVLQQSWEYDEDDLSASLKVAYLDQGETDFGAVADAVLAAMTPSALALNKEHK